MEKILVAQSGGPTSAINATLAGVINYAKRNNFEIIGGLYGISGILNRNFIDLSKKIKNDCDLETLKITPSSALGSCRYKLNNSDLEKILQIFKEENIKYFIYIGGNDSMDTVDKLSEYFLENNEDIYCIGAPKTIDNDLVLTDHTPGFGSAAKFVADSIYKVARDIDVYDYKTITIVEIMGRESGFLTASAMIPKFITNMGADFIILSEDIFDYNKLKKLIDKTFEKKPNILIAVSEGIKYEDGTYVSEDKTKVDNFGHTKIEQVGTKLKEMLLKDYNLPIRSIELSILQRASIQSKVDIEESFSIGEFAAKSVVNCNTSKMVSIERLSDDPYEVKLNLVDVSKVANKVKKVEKKYIDNDYTLNKKFLNYLLPLIQGEPEIKYKNGLPVYFDLK